MHPFSTPGGRKKVHSEQMGWVASIGTYYLYQYQY